MLDGPAAEQPPQHVEGLVEQATPPPSVGDLAEGAELPRAVVAETNADDDPAARKMIERAHLPSQHPGAPARQRRDERADTDPLGRGRHRRQRHPRIGHAHAAGPEDVVPQVEALPAGLLGGMGEVGNPAGIGELGEGGHEQSEPHRTGLCAPRGKRCNDGLRAQSPGRSLDGRRRAEQTEIASTCVEEAGWTSSGHGRCSMPSGPG